MIATLSFAVAMISSAPTCRTADRRVESVIATKVRELRGIEYCQFRQYSALDDLDQDGTDDFVMTFAVEGAYGRGNDVVQFLVVFPSTQRWTPAVLQVGKRGKRLSHSISVQANRIEVEFSEYKPNDALCCPTGTSHQSFSIKQGALVPVGAPQ